MKNFGLKLQKNRFFTKDYKKKCLGGFCQLTFSQILAYPNSIHSDYLDIKKDNSNNYCFMYWHDKENRCWLYNKELKIKKRKVNMGEVKKLSIIIPIQML